MREIRKILDVRGVGHNATLVGIARDNGSVQPFQIKAMLNELSKELNEGLIAGGLARIHVVCRIHQSDAKIVCPHTIDDCFGKVRLSGDRNQSIRSLRVVIELDGFYLT